MFPHLRFSAVHSIINEYKGGYPGDFYVFTLFVLVILLQCLF